MHICIPFGKAPLKERLIEYFNTFFYNYFVD